MTASPILPDALAAHAAGLCVLPPTEDGSKAPFGDKWKKFQTTRSTEAEVQAWYANGRTGLGIVCGKVSGGLEMFEFEGRAVDAGMADAFVDAADACGLGDLVGRIAEGYTEATPSGGLHWLFLTESPVTTKLARRPATEEELVEDPDNRVKPLIETKGEGGFTIIAPSHGKVHPTGKPWALVAGGFATIATISAEEHQALHDMARTFDQMPTRSVAPPKSCAPAIGDDVRPGDDLNARTTWADVLEPEGWTAVYTRGDTTYWRRPGKTAPGISATTGHAGTDLLWVFTSSTIFEPERSYDRFGAFAALHHDGDVAAAARALAEEGYGRQEPHQQHLVDGQRQGVVGTAERQRNGCSPASQPPSEPEDDLRLVVQSRARRSSIDGAAFILDAPPEVQAVWGDAELVAWSSGEPLLINGPSGVGKTTIAQQVTLARLGLRAEVLGLPVVRDGRRVLYIAADRPPQASRSMRRMVTEEDRQVLADRLVIWRGPLPYDLTRVPEVLAMLAEDAGAGTVIIDSLKDVAGKLSEDETGSMVNRAMQMACLAGVEVMALHHQRKRAQGAEKPKTLDDVYGSTWLTAGAGSVLLVWGQAGDAVVELSHLKQPVDTIGPLTLLHDHERGMTVVQDEVDLLAVVRTSNGLTAQGAARAMFRKESPKPNEVERARRRLERLCTKGLAHRVEPKRGGDGGTEAARYWATDGLREAS
jgi:RecA-superfamily ATPases implicated in signal transduction